MDTREVLRPYRKQRLGFEGVLVDIIEPNRRNGYTYGLVFASVYAPNENIELDHVVIQLNRKDFSEISIQLFKRYHFTAQIEHYYKVVRILGISAIQENFMLQRINVRKLYEIEESNLPQPTLYVMNRINNIMLCKTSEIQHTEEELIEKIKTLPNDGSVEQFIGKYALIYQHKKVTEFEIIDSLYS